VREVEVKRLAVLRSMGILDTPPEAIFDHITRLAAMTFGVPTAVVSLVDADRQWFKSCVGLDVAETGRDVAFCDYAIRQDEVMVVLDAASDPRFVENPLVTGELGIRFYAGAPLTHVSGARLGTLCLIGYEPRTSFDDERRQQLAAMAEAVMAAISMRHDISSFLRIDAERAERERMLAQVETLAGVGHWSLDLRTNNTTWSPAVYAIHGLDPAAGSPPYEQPLGCCHPDDRARVEAMVQHAIEAGESYVLQARLLRADGEVRHVKAYGEPRFDDSGEIIGLDGLVMDVTDVVTTDEALRRNEARLQFLTEKAADVILRVEPDRGVTWASPNVSRYGYGPMALHGKAAFDFVHPEDLSDFRAFEAARLRGEDETNGGRANFRFRTADGAWARFESSSTIIRSAEGAVAEVVMVMRDVTEQQKIQDALTESEMRYRLLADNASDLIACVDQSAQFTYLSPAIRSLLGYEPEELVGRSTKLVLHPDDYRAALAAYSNHLASDQSTESFEVEYRAYRKDGQMVWLASHPKAMFDSDGTLLGFQDVVRDVSDQRRLEDDLRAARDEAAAAARIKADFMANMSHEIRTPLTAILGFTSLLAADNDLKPDARHNVGRISAAGQALMAIVNDVLDFSKLEAGEMSIRRRPTALDECLYEALSLFSPQAEAKGIALDLACDDEIAWVDLDPDRLRQILLNFIGNAVKFTETGSVRVSAFREPATELLRVEIQDSGPGMDAAEQAKLFQRFSQVDGTSTRKHEGTGLGLAISRGLAVAMGGEVGVRSTPGEGSTFWFTVFAPACEAPDLVEDTPLADYALRGSRLLVVDDNRVNRELVKALLSPFGVVITEAEDGLQAVELAAAEPFDLILMDMRMPRCDGPDATLRIRQNEGPNRQVTILAFTADYDLQVVGEQAVRGFDGVVRKPLDGSSLFVQVAEALVR